MRLNISDRISLILCQQFEDTIQAIYLGKCLQYYGLINIKNNKQLNEVFNGTLMEYYRNELGGKLFELLYNEIIKYLNKCQHFIRNNRNYLHNYNQILMERLNHSKTNVFKTVSDFNKNNIEQIHFCIELMDTSHCYVCHSFDTVDMIKVNNFNVMNCNQNKTENFNELFYDKQMRKLELYSNNKVISNITCRNIIKPKLNSIIGGENIGKYDQNKAYYWNYYYCNKILNNKYIL